MASIDAAVAEATRAVNAAVRNEYSRRNFTITKFGKHRDGYLHAMVTLNGERFYIHRQWGSWLMPIPNSVPTSRSMREVRSPFKEALEEKALPFDRRDRQLRQEREEAKKREDRRARDSSEAPDTAGSGEVRAAV